MTNGRPVDLSLGLVKRLRLMSRLGHWPLLGDEAADEIERAWAARDAAVADLEAHAEAEVRRAVAAERERWHDAIQAAMPQHERFDDQRGAANALRAVLSACRPNVEAKRTVTARTKG